MNDQKTQVADTFLAEDLKRLAITGLLTIALLVLLVMAQQRFSLFENIVTVDAPVVANPVVEDGAVVELETSELPEVPAE